MLVSAGRREGSGREPDSICSSGSESAGGDAARGIAEPRAILSRRGTQGRELAQTDTQPKDPDVTANIKKT